ncbi:MAG: hypothetical protein R3C01_01115 [Planctomycetaceae bacterium]
MPIKQTFRRTVGAGLLAASFFCAFSVLLGEEQVVPYDGRCEAPCPPESLAFLLEPLTKNDNLTLTLVRHPNPSSQPPDQRAMWVCMLHGKPLWVVAKAPDPSEKGESGIAARALERARTFLAEHEEMRDKEVPRNWELDKKTLLPAYQSKKYGLQITEIKLVDRKTESWEITAKPIEDCLGGEIWMRFEKGREVSVEYGK